MKANRFQKMAWVLFSAALVVTVFAGCREKGTVGDIDGVADGAVNEASGIIEAVDGGGKAMGRYMEEELSLPANFSSIDDMKRLEDGSVRMVGRSEGKESVWESKDSGVSWEKLYDFPDEIPDDIRCQDMSLGGRVVCACDEGQGTDGKENFYLLEPDGSVGLIPFELPRVEELNINLARQVLFVGNEQILIGDDTGIFYLIRGADGSVERTFDFGDSGEIYFAFAVEKMLLFLSGSEILLYDSETGEEKSPGEALQSGITESGIIYAADTLDGGESIYYISEKGMYHYKFGGSVVEQLIDGELNSLGSFSVSVGSLLMLDEQNLLVSKTDDTEEREARAGILRFTYSADTPAKPDKELKVYSLYEDNWLQQVVARFQKEHGDLYVHYETALSGEDGVTAQDALKTLATEIMAGDGPDVLALDGMPLEAYAEKGILRDLSSLIPENREEYFENILNAYRNAQGELCAVPARFLIPMAQGGSDYYVPGEDFSAFIQRTGALDNMEPREVIARFQYGSSAAWQKEDKTLDESKIREFFGGLKQLYGEPMAETEESRDSVPRGTGLMTGEFNLLDGKWHISAGLFGYNPDYALLLAVTKQLEGGDFGCMPGQADHVFVPSMTVGISSKCGEPEAAEEFVRFLFTEDVQKISQGGMPVHKGAFKSAIDGHWYEDKPSRVETDEISFDLVPRTEEEIRRITELAESLTTPALQDQVIEEAVLEQGEKTLKGEITPEEGAANVMRKVNLYLAE